MDPKVYYFTPYALDGNLGMAYNQSCELVPDDQDWICIRDGDTMFLNFNWGEIIANSIRLHASEYSIFTCYASRIGGIAQQFNNSICEDPNVIYHRNIAVDVATRFRGRVRDISRVPYISGHFILFQKWVWKNVKFSEKSGFLGIDNDFFARAAANGIRVGLIEDLYLFHYYRLAEGYHYEDHLKPRESKPKFM